MVKKVIAGCELFIVDGPGSAVRNSHSITRDFYAPFPKKTKIYNYINIHARIEPLQVKFDKLLFRANEAWSFYQDHFFKWMVLSLPNIDQPLWTARFNHDFTEVTLYCGPHMIIRIDNQTVIKNPLTYPLDQVLMMHFLALNAGMLVHAAGWRVNGAGWMFAGISGAGKSTISNLIVEHTGADFLSDDRIIVRKIKDEFFVYGTPWPGDAGYAVNASVPLKGIFFLSKGQRNSIRKMASAEAFFRLAPVSSIPWYDREKVVLMLDFCNDLIESIPMYELTFVPGQAIVSYLEEFISDMDLAEND